MGSSVSSFSGLSAANIAALFGTAGSSATAKDGTNTSAAAAAGPSITGADGGGTNAAKAIQAIVTQIQLEQIQSTSQGKASTFSLASVASTYEKTASVPSGTVAVSVTTLDSDVTTTGDDLAGAVGTLMAQVKAQEAQVEASKGGVLFTKDETVFGGFSFSDLDVWTPNSVTLNLHETGNRGFELDNEEGTLDGILDFTAKAQQFQKTSVTGPLAANAQTPATAGDLSTPPETSGGGPALYLEIGKSYAQSFAALEGVEQRMVSDFLKGALPDQNGKAPENGAGFSYDWNTGSSDDDSAYGFSAVMISNYDPTAVANRADIYGGQNGQNAWMTADQKTAAMGGIVTYDSGVGYDESMIVIVPLKTS